MTTHEPPTVKAVPTALELLDATAATLQNFEKLDCPLVTVTVNGNALTVSCNGGRTETLSLHPGGTEGPVLIGRGGYFLPRFHPERWRILAGVVPMTPQQEGHPFGLCEVAASLGFTVMTSAVHLGVKYVHQLKLLRLEHPDGRELWGSIFVEDYPDGQINDSLILGGVIVARQKCDATFEDAAIAQMSDADLQAENLARPDPKVFEMKSIPLTTWRLQEVLDALQEGTAHTLAYPELALS
ncbi:hypothetical protein Q0M94_25220 (plasmid) [Deinococcus radiomollis]|uniref:hypothetical protein n=1 Tax=Deinococcus radiomollis TaxID=468916 RepID=UPI003892A4D2